MTGSAGNCSGSGTRAGDVVWGSYDGFTVGGDNMGTPNDLNVTFKNILVR